MADDSSGEIAGIFVQARGTGRSLVAGSAAGAVGALATSGGASASPLAVRQLGYLSVAPDRVTLFGAKRKVLLGGFKATDEVLAEVPQSSIDDAQLEHGRLLGTLTMRFRDGTTWTFEVPRVGNKTADQAAASMGATGGS